MSESLSKEILAAASSLLEGATLSPKEFLHLGARAAVDQALSRLARQGALLRIGRGAYALPVKGRFGTRPPSPEKAVEALAAKTGETVVSHGAAAANALGLTTQVPVREVFLTSGPNKKLSFGLRLVEVKHAPHWQLLLAHRPAGAAIRALAWLGRGHVSEALTQLSQRLPPAEWKALAEARSGLPAWMAQAIGQANLSTPSHA